MSKIKQVYVVSPPLFLADNNFTEFTTSTGHLCSQCHGQGTIITVDANGETAHVPCPTCLGHKRLDAEITIKWKPSIKK